MSRSLSGPDLIPSGVSDGSMDARSPNPLMEQGQTTLNAGFNSQIAQTRNVQSGNPRAIGHYSGQEGELIIDDRDPCFIQRGVYSANGTSSRTDAFSSFNGFPRGGIKNEMDFANAVNFVGFSTRQTFLNTKTDPNSAQGAAIVMTGTWCIAKHYGHKTIYVGDPIRMRLPSLDNAQLQADLAARQTGQDFPYPSKILATPEPVNPLDVVDFWRQGARQLLDTNFLTNGQPNPALNVRMNNFNTYSARSNSNGAMDTMAVQIKQLFGFVGMSFLMNAVEGGLVTPVTMDPNPLSGAFVRAGSSQIARQRLLGELNKIRFSRPDDNVMMWNAGGTPIATPITSVTTKQQRKVARDDFYRFVSGLYGLTSEDQGTLEHRGHTRMFHLRTLGKITGSADHAKVAGDLINQSLYESVRPISLLSQYSNSSGSFSDQFRSIQNNAFEAFMRNSGFVLDYLYKHCAGSSLSLSSEGTVLHGTRN